MEDKIVIKGNQHGLTIIVKEPLPMDVVKEILALKLNASRKFFGNSVVTIAIRGQVFSESEQEMLIDVIHHNSDLVVSCLVEEAPLIQIDKQKPSKPIEIKSNIPKDMDKKTRQSGKKIKFAPSNDMDLINDSHALLPQQSPSESLDSNEKTTNDKHSVETNALMGKNYFIKGKEPLAQFRYGTLRSGQEIVVEDSIIFIGNVHSGAKITANGHVVIIGHLRGAVHAGYLGDSKTFVIATKMEPTQIRIGEYLGRSGDYHKNNPVPQIAFVDEERIYIEDVETNILESLNLNKS